MDQVEVHRQPAQVVEERGEIGGAVVDALKQQVLDHAVPVPGERGKHGAELFERVHAAEGDEASAHLRAGGVQAQG